MEEENKRMKHNILICCQLDKIDRKIIIIIFILIAIIIYFAIYLSYMIWFGGFGSEYFHPPDFNLALSKKDPFYQ